jgi:hypothetical protein
VRLIGQSMFVRNLLLSSLFFIASLLIVLSCNKKDSLKGCTAGFSGTHCNLKGINFISDTTSILFDSVQSRYYFYAYDDFFNSSVYISVYAPLQDMEGDGFRIQLADEYGKAKAVAFSEGNSFSGSYGNFRINVDYNTKKACGDFKFQNDGESDYVTQGEFKAIPILFKK